MSTDGKKVSELDPLPLPALAADELNAVRAGNSYRSSLTDLNPLIGGRARIIEPTGGDDHATLQNAIDDMSYDRTDLNASREAGAILLTGHYQLSQGLVFGDMGTTGGAPYNDSTLEPPRLIGLGQANLRYTGGNTDESLLTYYNPLGWAGGTYLGNLMVWCNTNCRGIRVHKCNYAFEMSGIQVRDSRQLGVDMIDCHGSSLRNIRVQGFAGLGMRLHNHNNATVDGIKLQGAAGSTDQQWPDPAQSDILSINGSPVQTATTERAALHISGNCECTPFMNFMPEGANMGGLPLVYGDGLDHVTFECVRLEGSTATEEMFKFDDARHIVIRQVIESANPSKCFVRLGGTSRYVRVEQITARYYTDAVMLLDSGFHSGHSVARVEDNTQTVTFDKWIGQVSSPALRGPVYANNNHEVLIPWEQ